MRFVVMKMDKTQNTDFYEWYIETSEVVEISKKKEKEKK